MNPNLGLHLLVGAGLPTDKTPQRLEKGALENLIKQGLSLINLVFLLFFSFFLGIFLTLYFSCYPRSIEDGHCHLGSGQGEGNDGCPTPKGTSLGA